MLSEKERGASDKAAPKNESQSELYRNITPESSKIDELLAGLLFSLQNPNYTLAERALALDAIDGLIRLKADLGLIRRIACVS